MVNPTLRPTVDNTTLMVVDIQEKLLPAIAGNEECLAAAMKLVRAAILLRLPLLLTEQYPAGLGRTVAPLAGLLNDVPVVEKMRFSACVPQVTQRLTQLHRPVVIVCGIEAHVCVQQTVLDLLELSHCVYLCADAVSSRRPMDRNVALERMARAGAIITTVESLIFELLGEAGTEVFKQVLKIVK